MPTDGSPPSLGTRRLGGSVAVPRRVNLLGGPVDLVSQDEVIAFIEDAVSGGRKAIIGNQNLHSLELSMKNADLRAFFAAADLIEIDSMPLVQWGRLMGLRLSRLHRSTYLDWRDKFWRVAASQGWRVFLLGSAEAVNAKAVARLSLEWPGLNLDGHHGYFDRGGGENTAVIERINEFRPDVLLVGMGMPLQEIWIHRNYPSLATGVVLSLGAAFDYEAEVQKAAPRFYADLNLEWLYRLAHEPRRLFKRYLIDPWALIVPAIADLAGLLAPRASASHAVATEDKLAATRRLSPADTVAQKLQEPE